MHFIHVTVGCGDCLLRTAAILTRVKIRCVPVPPLMLGVRLLVVIVVLGRFVKEFRHISRRPSLLWVHSIRDLETAS